MGDTYAVPALMRKRAEIARQVEHAAAELRQLQATLGHVDAVLRLFDLDAKPPSVAAPLVPDLHLRVLDALREAAEPITSRQVARVLAERHGIKDIERLDKRVGGYLRRQGGRLVERVSDGPARWKVA